MEKMGKVKEEHNCLIVSLSGDQSFVKIFNANGELIRYSQTKGVAEIQQIVVPGEYKVETDGTVKGLSSVNIELEKGKDPTQPSSP